MVADSAGVSHETLLRWENGGRHVFTSKKKKKKMALKELNLKTQKNEILVE